MSIVVAVENSSRQPDENTQALLDHLSIVYVASAESESTGKAGALPFLLWGCGSVALLVLAKRKAQTLSF